MVFFSVGYFSKLHTHCIHTIKWMCFLTRVCRPIESVWNVYKNITNTGDAAGFKIFQEFPRCMPWESLFHLTTMVCKNDKWSVWENGDKPNSLGENKWKWFAR